MQPERGRARLRPSTSRSGSSGSASSRCAFRSLALHHPRRCSSIAAAFGVARIKVDDSLSQLFRSDTPEFQQYEEVTRRFPSSEFDVLVVVEGKTLLAARLAREDARPRHRPAADRRHARHHLAVLGAAAAGGRTACRPAVSRGRCREGAAYDQLIERVKIERDPARQAPVGGRRAGADRAGARAGSRRRAAA